MPLAPQSNVEKYLHVIAGHGGEIPSEPLSRAEYYLDEIVKGGGIGGKLKPEIVSALPATGETGILYLVPSQGSGRNLCDEYFWIEDESRFELLGQTTVEVDLSGYVPNSRKVGGKSLANDIGITISGTGAIEVADNGTSSTIAFDISHKDSGVTAGSKGDTTNQTPGFGETFKVLSATVDAKGHVTALSEHNVKIPDTKVTTSMDGLMSKEDKVKLDEYASKGSATKGVYIDASGSPQPMAHELNADVPANFASATAAPLMDGTASAGTAAKYAREDHIHPTDVSRASASDVAALESENALLRELINGIDTPIYRNTSGNPATFADGYAANVKALSVEITPTQSGSGDPYPPGGGRNLIPMTLDLLKANNNLGTWNGNAYTRNGITFTANTDAGGNVVGVTLNGTISSGSTSLNLGNVDFMANTAYLVSGAVQNDVNARIAVFSKGSDTGSGYRYEPTEDDPGREISIYINTAGTISNVTFHPMIRRASDTDTTFAPYSNVRPISGVTSVGVTRTGKNLLEITATTRTVDGVTFTVNHDAGTITVDGTNSSSSAITFLFAEPSGWAPGQYRFAVANPNSSTSGAYIFYRINGYGRNLTTTAFNTKINAGDSGFTYVCVAVAAGATVSKMIFRPMIYYSQHGVDDSFEPYRQSQSVTVSLVDSSNNPLTVYGGTLDVTTGELTVTTHYFDASTLLWKDSVAYPGGFFSGIAKEYGAPYHAKIWCSHAKTVNTLQEYVKGTCYSDNSFNIRIMEPGTTLNEWTTFLQEQSDAGTPVQMLFKLATPVTYQLTPAQLATLSGYNSVTTDAGTLSVAYRADTTLSKAKE